MHVPVSEVITGIVSERMLTSGRNGLLRLYSRKFSKKKLLNFLFLIEFFVSRVSNAIHFVKICYLRVRKSSRAMFENFIRFIKVR